MTKKKTKKCCKKAAGKHPSGRKPRRWDKAISAAYLRMLGASQERAAKEVGCAERSLWAWEKGDWWPDAQAEARQRWLQGGDAMARRGLFKALVDPDEYASTARWWADRRISGLSPPKVRAEVTGEDGKPLATRTEVVFIKPDGSVGDGKS